VKPLSGLHVVEVAGSIAGAYCGKLFADQGADVVLAGEHRLRRHEALYLHAGKRLAKEITRNDVDNADPKNADPKNTDLDNADLKNSDPKNTDPKNTDLDNADLKNADVVITSSMPEPLTPSTPRCGSTIDVAISPYGTHGPKARWKGTDLTDYAAGGHLYLYGDPDREPLRGPANQPAYAAGLFGFIGAMAALLVRDRTGQGQAVDVSHVQAMAALHQFTLIRYLLTGDVVRRMGNRYTGQGQPNGIYPCADGWISIAAPLDHQVEFVLAVSGLDHLMDHPDITSVQDFQLQPELLDNGLIAWLADKSMAEVTELFQTMRIPTGPSLNMLQLLDDPQLVARGFFGPMAGAPPAVQAPKPPFTITATGSDGAQNWTPPANTTRPLAGLRVLDLTRVWAGPLCTRILSDLGADVVWVEAPWSRGGREIPQSVVQSARYFVDDAPAGCQWNRNGHTIKYALGKRSLAVDLTTDAGHDVLARLIPHHHVLVENYSTRVMPQLGFSEAKLHELNPELIYVTMPGFGRSGPAEHWVAYGSSVDSHAGLSSLIGYQDQTPWKGGVAWPDPIAGLHATSAILASLWDQQTTGAGGRTIEAAQFESTVAAVGDRIVEAQLDGVQVPGGNREPRYLVQGVYPCTGDDAWIAISLPDQAAWNVVTAMAGEVLANVDPDDHDAADAALGRWTATQDATELATRLQEVGIVAAAVATAAMVLADPHLLARGAFTTVDQPAVGGFTAPTTPITFAATPLADVQPAPTLGEHNESLLRSFGFAPEEITELQATGVIAVNPPR